jgi:predicted  nucleic acid-binding Zn-ribbon protein
VENITSVPYSKDYIYVKNVLTISVYRLKLIIEKKRRKMTKDELLNKISLRMQEINTRLNELSKEKKELRDEQSRLIESWNIKTLI